MAPRTLAAPMSALTRWWLVLLLGLGLSAPAVATEEIRAFDSRVEVQTDGDLIVTETIRVQAEGERIRRGIFRDFPTIRRLPTGLVQRHGFEVLSVTRDGRLEPWHAESITGGRRVSIGSADRQLAPGEYSYTLRYRTTGQMRRLGDADEVYWNVTGNFWWFPIRSATATIQFPPDGTILREAFYTGGYGEDGAAARVSGRGADWISFATTRALAPREGLTVAAAIPQGVVAQPSAPARTLHLLSDNLGLFLLLAAVPIVGGYYLWSWLRVGRDPPGRVIIPLFEPPPGLSPAAACRVFYRGAGKRLGGASRALVAALMSLAVQGRIRLSKQEDDLVIERGPNRTKKGDKRSRCERTLEYGLLGTRARFVVSEANGERVKDAVTRFETELDRDQDLPGRYFRFNHGRIAVGALLGVLALAGYFWLFPGTEAQNAAVLLALGVGIVGGGLAVAGWRRLTGDLPGGNRALGWVLLAAGLMVLWAFAATLLGLGGGGPLAWLDGLLPTTTPPVADWFATWAAVAAALGALALALLHQVFAVLLFAPTPVGREVGDQLAGFRLYLSVAEAERMNLPGRPDFTTDLFDRFLPYAIALGVERPWAAALEAHMARGLPGDPEMDYSPPFDSGSGFDAGAITASAAAIASTLGTSFASAMPASQSSDGGSGGDSGGDSGGGSGGGGSSGGGGGGGGGGGW